MARFNLRLSPSSAFKPSTSRDDDGQTGEEDMADIALTVEFSGGLEMLFSDTRRHQVVLPGLDEDGQPSNIAFLIRHLCRHVMQDTRRELFVLDGHIRPGILVLINDADWELEGEELYELRDKDTILFVSTLHGG